MTSSFFVFLLVMVLLRAGDVDTSAAGDASPNHDRRRALAGVDGVEDMEVGVGVRVARSSSLPTRREGPASADGEYVSIVLVGGLTDYWYTPASPVGFEIMFRAGARR